MLDAASSAAELASVVGFDPPLIRRLHQMRQRGEWHAVEDLAELDYDA